MIRQIAFIILFILLFFTGVWLFEEIKYSWKMNQEIDNHNATCYLERGMFNFPLAKVCTWNETIMVQKGD